MECEDFSEDACECIWNNDSMQSLLSILRQTQSHCTENECYPVTRLPGPQNSQPSADFFFLTLILGVLAFLYTFRPRALRHSSRDVVKSRDNGPGSNGDPPVPPPTAN